MKFSILFALTIFLSSPLYSQESKMAIEIYGGPTLSSITTSNALTEIKSRNGFDFGLNVGYQLSTIFSIHTGLIFERKGGITTNGSGIPQDNWDSEDWNLDYLILPLSVRASVGKKIRAFGEAGMYAAFLTSSKVKLLSYDDELMDTISFDKLGNGTDYGFLAGLGMVVPLNDKLSVVPRGKIAVGLTDFRKDYPYDFEKNRSFSLVIGVNYKL